MRFPILLIPLLICSLFPTQAQAQAVYNGRYYNSRVCSNPNCQMCAYIEAQLRQARSTPIIVASPSPSPSPSDILQEFNAFKEAILPSLPENLDVLHVEDFAPTPYDYIPKIINIIGPTKSDILYDIGCGDARLLLAATHTFNIRGVGVELNKETYKVALQRLHNFNLTHKINLYRGDALKYTYDQATIVYVYLYPELIEQLIPKLPSGCRLFSYSHKIPKVDNQFEHKLDTSVSLFEWTKP